MRFVLLFLLVICVVLWVERFYWKRQAQLMIGRLAGIDRNRLITTLFDAWLDGRIDSAVRKQQRRAEQSAEESNSWHAGNFR
ncbi:MAG: hypothetical protein Kow001_14080 [Acidobacteriota bacterium]